MNQVLETSEIELDGQRYRIGKLNAINQFHTTRRIAPVISTLMPVFAKFKQDGGLGNDLLGFAGAIKPFADGLAAMSDEDTEFIFGSCLGAVRRLSGDRWVPVWAAQANDCMFDDMDMGVLVRLVIRVIQDNLGPFIRGLLTGQ